MLKQLKHLLQITTLIALVIGASSASLVNAQGNGNGNGKGNGNKKVTICHVPPGNPGNAHTITVSENALGAHLGHGDYEGACGEMTEIGITYIDLTGVVAAYDVTAGTIRLEDGTILILYHDIDFDIPVGSQILVRGYEIEEGRFIVIWITFEAELVDTEPEPRLPVWLNITGQVTNYNAEFGTFFMDGIPVIVTFAIPEYLTLIDGLIVTVHGELLPDGRLLVDDIDQYVAVEVSTETETEGESETEVSTDGVTTICHVPPGNSNNAHTITVGSPAVSAHLDHGDYVGACGEGESTEVITATTTIVETTCEGACNPEYIVLADAFGVSYTELEEWHASGYHVVEISRFYVIARLANVEVQEVAAQYEAAGNWKQLLEQYPDVTPAAFRANANLGNGRNNGNGQGNGNNK